MKRKIFNAPNTVTLSRVTFSLFLFVLLMVPMFVDMETLIQIPETHFTVLDLVSFVLFIVLASTDSVDGHLARSTGQVTDLGKVLDPLADKLLVDGTMVLLSVRAPLLLPPIFVALFIARDLMVDGVRIMAASKGHVVPANIWGKCKTVMEMVLLPVVILRGFPLNFADRAFDPSSYSSWVPTSCWDYHGELFAMVYCLILGFATLVMSLISGGIYVYQCRSVLIGEKKDSDEDTSDQEGKE